MAGLKTPMGWKQSTVPDEPKDIQSVEDLIDDPQNPNKGTLRGEQLLEYSFETVGAGRPPVVDRYGLITAGNKTVRMAGEKGIPIQVVRTEGDELVVVVRDDLDLSKDPKARTMAYLDNRVSEVGLAWDPEQLEKDLSSGMQLGTMFTADELDDILSPPEKIEERYALAILSVDIPRWDAFAKMLKDRYPHLPRPAGGGIGPGALAAWVKEQLDKELV
jgi:hypothetical protein